MTAFEESRLPYFDPVFSLSLRIIRTPKAPSTYNLIGDAIERKSACLFECAAVLVCFPGLERGLKASSAVGCFRLGGCGAISRLLCWRMTRRSTGFIIQKAAE